jgi:succinate dehydrogenase (ubiquinone) cytochrome b560 subunit
VYCFGAAYLVSPLFGWHLDVPTLVATFGSLPVAAKVGIKSVVAFPFAFHSINGLRHLTWDTGAGMSLQLPLTLALSNKQVIRTGWTVVGLTSAATIALVMM